MSEIDSGGPAFPMSYEQKQTGVWGLTKREWFAGMALQSLVKFGGDVFQDEIAKWAYVYADAMIRAGKGEK